MSLPKAREMRDAYQLVNGSMDRLDIQLTTEVAYNFRDYITQDFWPRILPIIPENAKQPPVRRYDAEADKTLFKFRDGFNRLTNPDAEIAYFTAFSLFHYSQHGWKFHALTTRYRDDNTDNKIQVRYYVDMYDGRLFDARREVRIIRELSEDAADERAMQELESGSAQQSNAERLAFERPLQDSNLHAMREHLQRTARRFIALS